MYVYMYVCMKTCVCVCVSAYIRAMYMLCINIFQFLLTRCLFAIDFYNWNRVKVRYCDGGSFSGDVDLPAEARVPGSTQVLLLLLTISIFYTNPFLHIMVAKSIVFWLYLFLCVCVCFHRCNGFTTVDKGFGKRS